MAIIENYWVTILKALGHPTRLQIVMELLNGTKCVTDIREFSTCFTGQYLPTPHGIAQCPDRGLCPGRSKRCYYVCRPELVEGVLSLLRNEQPEIKRPKL